MKAPKTFNFLKNKIKRLKEYIKFNEEEIKKYEVMIDEILGGLK